MELKRVLVTGASKGIGQAIALKLAQNNFDVTVHFGHDEKGALNTLEKIKEQGGKGHLISFDVSNEEQSRVVLEEDLNTYGPFYGIVSNAGITQDDAFPAMSAHSWQKVIDTNLNSFYNVIHPCIMPMIRLKQGGRIIVISSVSGLMGNRGQTNYAAAKAGLIGAAKSLAIELGKRNITVNTIAPGLIETAMSEIDPLALKEIMKLIPLRRMGQAKEVASLAAFLMSDEAAYITKEVISISGGL